MEEGGAYWRHGAGLLTKLPIVKAAIDLRDHVKEGRVKDVDDCVSLFDRSWLFERNWRRTEQRLDLLEHLALVFGKVNSRKARPLLKQTGYAAYLPFNSLPAGLSGMRRKDRMKLKLLEKTVRLFAAALSNELSIGHCELIDRISVQRHGHFSLALLQ